MKSAPLYELITERGFDKYQIGLRARFDRFEFHYTVTYCEPTDNPAMCVQLEDSKHIGRVTVWESGLCDLEVLDIATEETALYEHYELKDEEAFHTVFARFSLFMMKNAPISVNRSVSVFPIHNPNKSVL